MNSQLIMGFVFSVGILALLAFLFNLGQRTTVWYPTIRCALRNCPSDTEDHRPTGTAAFSKMISSAAKTPLKNSISGFGQTSRHHVAHLSSDSFLYHFVHMFPDTIDPESSAWVGTTPATTNATEDYLPPPTEAQVSFSNAEDKSLKEQMRRWAKFLVGDHHDTIVAAGLTDYDNCHVKNNGEVVWMLLVGHLRSFSDRLEHLREFRKAAPCSILVVYTMDHIEAEGGAWWGGDREQLAGARVNTDIGGLLEGLKSSLGPNFGYAVEKRANRGSMAGMLTLDVVLML